MALSPLDPMARSGGVLPSADPSALEVAMARNKQEDDLAKGIQALNQKAAADAAKVKSKEKMAAQKQLTELTKGTTFMPHTEASAKFYNDFIAREGKRWQDFDTGTGGDPMQPGTQAWIDRNRDLQAWEQMQASSKQIQDKYGKVAEHVMAHKGDYALDTLERIQEDYANPQHLIDQTFPDDPVAYIDLNKAIESRFGAIKPEITAWATQDGTASGTFEQVLLPDMQAVAEQMAVENPDLAAKLGETYESYTPEKKAQIQGMMKAYKITEAAAVAMDLAIAKYGAGKETQISEQVSESGYGRQKDEAVAQELIENVIGVASGAAQGKPLSEIPLSAEKAAEYAQRFPEQTRGLFDKEITSGAEFYTNLRDRTYNVTTDKEGKKHPEKIIGTLRYPNGDVRVVYNQVKKEGMAIKQAPSITERIPAKEVWSRVGIQIAKSDDAYDLGAVEDLFEKKYVGVGGTKGQVPLTGGGTGALDIENAGELD